MDPTRRRFSREFHIAMVRALSRGDVSHEELARGLAVSIRLVYGWCNAFQEDVDPLMKELHHLRNMRDELLSLQAENS